MGYLEELPDKIDRRRRDFRPTAPMLEAWQNYCNALLANEKFLQSMKLAQTVMVMRELEADKIPVKNLSTGAQKSYSIEEISALLA